MVTETDQVGDALKRVRRADPGQKVNLAELVVLGAERKIELLERERGDEKAREELRERFLTRTRTGAGIDWDALQDVHVHGWTHDPDA